MTRLAARLMARRAQRAIDERGVTMVIFGLLIVALLIIVAIVIDLGNARQEKRQLQNAADAAALAGANDLGTVNAANACLDAYKYSYNNMQLGTAPSSCPTNSTAGNVSISVTTPYFSGPPAFSAASLVNVRACKDVGTYFAKIIGVSSVHVCGNATARKIGFTPPPCPGTGCPTDTTDPDAPCTADDFLATGYYDHDSHLRNNPKTDSSGLNYDNQGMNAVADNNHTGGPPGGTVVENDWVGATYWSSTPIDRTTKPPKFTLTNTTTGSVVTSNTWSDSVTTGGPIYIKPMTSINGQPAFTTPPTYVYDIVWKVPGGNANNAAYTVSMVVYDSASAANPPDGKCGKTQWSFTKGTPPNPNMPCGENAFLGTISPAPGSVVHPGDTLTVSYQDESILYNVAGTDNAPVFAVDGNPLPQAPLGTANAFGPNSQAAYYGSTTYYTLKSPTSQTTKEKFSTDIQYKVPASFISGNHTFHLKAYDSDNNKPGGDCGIADWSLNVAGGASNVELVQ